MVDLIQSWHVVKHEPPQEWDTCQTRPANLAIDAVKAKVFNAIMKIDQMDDVAKSIRFWKKPDHVRTGDQQIPKGKLVLAPCLPMSNIGIKHGPSSVSLAIIPPRIGVGSSLAFHQPNQMLPRWTSSRSRWLLFGGWQVPPTTTWSTWWCMSQ
jgi:hypothetical protein